MGEVADIEKQRRRKMKIIVQIFLCFGFVLISVIQNQKDSLRTRGVMVGSAPLIS